MRDDFLLNLGEHLAAMRLIAKGALDMYEDEVSGIYSKAVREGNAHDAQYINLMGWALSLLDGHIRAMQDAYIRLPASQDAQNVQNAAAK